MTLPAFADFILNEVAGDEAYASMFDTETLSQLEALSVFTDSSKMTTAIPYRANGGSSWESMKTQPSSYMYTITPCQRAMSPAARPSRPSVSLMQKDIAKNPLFSSYMDDASLEQLTCWPGSRIQRLFKNR